MSSLACLHTGHHALSMCLILSRNALSDTCPILCWQILLALFLERLMLLISLMKLFDNMDESRVLNLLYHSDIVHSHCHLILSLDFLCCFIVDLFILICFQSSRGRFFVLEVLIYFFIAFYATVSCCPSELECISGGVSGLFELCHHI